MKKSLNFFLKWGPVFVLALGLMIIIIDTTLLNVALAYVIRDLKTDIQSIQWVITAYALTLAALTITGGRLGDLWGRKKMFIIGAAIFAIGSFIASISNNVGTMIIGESIIEGIGAALMMPATLSLLVSTYRGRDRAIAMGVWGGTAGAASAIGPILGGYLTTHYNWRWGFRINVFVATILILGSLIVKETRDKEEKPTLDIFGVILSSVGLLSVVFGIIESSTYGWYKAKEIFTFFGHQLDLGGISVVTPSILFGIIVLILFVAWELRIERLGNTPLVSMRIFKNKQFTSGVAVTALLALGQTGMIFALPIFFESVRGLDAYHTGLAFLPTSLTALVVAPLSAAVFSRRISAKRLIQAGLLFSTVGMLVIMTSLRVDANTQDFIFGMIIYGAGIGLSMSTLSNLTLSAVSVQEAGEASGVNNTFRQIGSSLGSAIIGAALLTALAANLNTGIDSSKVIPDKLKSQISSAVAHQTSNVEFGGGAQISTKLPTAVSQEIVSISHQATTDANRRALAFAALFTGIGFLMTFFLPKKADMGHDESPTKKII
ncbi:MAG: DHA2 family efflux MFS transporter permease subunit, partial [Candidatus Berkelbacteria bacterium]